MTLVALVVASHATCARCSESGGSESDATTSLDGSRATPSRVGSCDRVTASSLCSEYSGGYLAQYEAVLTSACGKLSGTFVYAECPNTSVLGSCALSTGEVRKFYASGAQAYDATRAESECEGSYKGTWAALR
ncbi:MAG: hypothetical protein KF819_22405 [Labilithrix sp.]|nr:hypothetical protein [Labilithrix sp.]